MGDITTRDLLDVQNAITTAMTREVDRVERGINEVKEEQAEQKQQIGELRDEQAEQRRDMTDLRKVVEERTGGIGLTKPQKTALWTVVGAAVTEIARHLAPLFSGFAAWIKGGAPRP